MPNNTNEFNSNSVGYDASYLNMKKQQLIDSLKGVPAKLGGQKQKESPSPYQIDAVRGKVAVGGSPNIVNLMSSNKK